MTALVTPEIASSDPGAPDPVPKGSTSQESPTSKDKLPYPLPPDMPWPEPLIKTPRLTIRPYHASDAAEAARLANNRSIARNMTNRFPYPYTVSDAESFISRSLNPRDSGVYAWTISLTPEGQPIGGCGLEPGSDVFARSAEMGYWLGEEYWGKGYASEVCSALTDWAFEQEKGVKGDGEALLRMAAGVYSGNPGSGRVLVKCGYKHEGTLRGTVWKWGEQKDVILYGIIREEWEAQRRKT